MAAKDRMRADQLLAERGYFESRTRARQEILAGTVLADGKAVEKPGQLLPAQAQIDLRDPANPYVSRGGLKLAHAIDHFSLSPAGCHALDVGASTGGFTDVLLRKGALSVCAVDVGQGQLHEKLRADKRVQFFEKTDIRDFDPALLMQRINYCVLDVSFISLLNVLPSVLQMLTPNACLIALIKPQFEVGRSGVEKGGIVKDEQLIADTCARIAASLSEQPGWTVLGMIESPIKGGDGNREFLMAATRKLPDDR